MIFRGFALFHEQRAPKLILSGGPGDGAVHETQAMQRLAEAYGVPDSAILLDPAGNNTSATVRYVRQSLNSTTSVIAVSHFYHLPRVKLAFASQGMDAYTVPAAQTRRLARTPQFMLREIVAFWAYFLGLRR